VPGTTTIGRIRRLYADGVSPTRRVNRTLASREQTPGKLDA